MSEEARPPTSDALAALPIFPLPDLVLFPGSLIPLHIFEPRYRELVADVLAGSSLLALARLRPGYQPEYQGRPPVFAIAGLGAVVASDLLPDGRYNLLVRGIARVAVDDELPPTKVYRQVRARRLVDHKSRDPGRLDSCFAALADLCRRLAPRVEGIGAELEELLDSGSPPGATADLLAAALVRDPDERQTLLETLDPADRVSQVLDAASRLLVELGGKTTDLPN